MATASTAALHESLRDYLPSDALSEDTAAFTVDGVTPQLLVSPANTKEVSAALRWANQKSAAVIPWGAGSRMWLGAPPERYVVAISLFKLKRIVEHEPADMTITAEAGGLVSSLQQHLAQHNQWLALDPPGDGTIGGLLATNASGPSRMRYGTARDQLIGMEIVGADGEILRFGGRVVKNVAGYDMAKLHIGGLGSLGIITQAAFKVAPLAGSNRISRITGPLESLMSTSLYLGQSGLALDGLTLSQSGGDCHLDVLFAGGAASVERSHDEVVKVAEAAGLSLVESTPEPDPEADIVVRVSVQPTKTLSICRELLALDASVTAYPTSGIVRGHWQANRPPSRDGLDRLRTEYSQGRKGALILEKAPPDLKRNFDVWGPVRADFSLMRGLKEQFDPQRILSPGRFVGNL